VLHSVYTRSENRTRQGLANYYRRFVEGYSRIVLPLTNLLRKHHPLEWSPEAQAAFDAITVAYTSAPVWRHFDPELPIQLQLQLLFLLLSRLAQNVAVESCLTSVEFCFASVELHLTSANSVSPRLSSISPRRMLFPSHSYRVLFRLSRAPSHPGEFCSCFTSVEFHHLTSANSVLFCFVSESVHTKCSISVSSAGEDLGIVNRDRTEFAVVRWSSTEAKQNSTKRDKS